MSLAVYLNFDGNTREAIQYYSEIFGFAGDPKIMIFGDMDPNATEETRNLIANAQIYIHGTLVMFSDAFPGWPFQQGNSVSLTIISHDENEVRTLFEKLSEGGKVQMDLQQTMWSPLYGTVTDKFGTEWQLNYDAKREFV